MEHVAEGIKLHYFTLLVSRNCLESTFYRVELQQSVITTAHKGVPKLSPLFYLLKPTGHVINQQFNIQQLYVLPTPYLCVLCLSENKRRLVPLTA